MARIIAVMLQQRMLIFDTVGEERMDNKKIGYFMKH